MFNSEKSNFPHSMLFHSFSLSSKNLAVSTAIALIYSYPLNQMDNIMIFQYMKPLSMNSSFEIQLEWIKHAIDHQPEP